MWSSRGLMRTTGPIDNLSYSELFFFFTDLAYHISCASSQFPKGTSLYERRRDRTHIHGLERPAWDLGIGGEDGNKDDRGLS